MDTPPEFRKVNALRQEQRELVNRLNDLESNLTETKLVAEALQQVDPSRKCYRSQGGILVEQKVEDVIPALEKSRDEIEKEVENTKKLITEKGKDILNFVNENNLLGKQKK